MASLKVCKIWFREWAAHIQFTKPLLKKGKYLQTFRPNKGVRNTLHVKRYKDEQEQQKARAKPIIEPDKCNDKN